MLVRQIGAVQPILSDAQVLLNAAAGGGSMIDTSTASAATVLPAGVPKITVDMAAPPATGAPPASITPAGGAPVACDCSDGSPLLWAGVGVGTALLLARGEKIIAGTIGKKKSGPLVPLLIVGGVAAWWYFSRPSSGTVTPTGGTVAPGASSTPAAVDPNKSLLQQQYANQQKQLNVIFNASPDTLAIWARLVGMWDSNATTQQLYSTYPNGAPGASWDASIGKWWENFKAQNGI